MLGEIDARATDAAGRSAAESRLREALALAEQLGMRPVVAQCHLGLGRLLAAPAGRAHLAQAAALYRDMKMAHGLAEAERAIAVGETRA